MPEPTKVAVFVGLSAAPRLLEQDYEHLLVEYNMGGLEPSPDPVFYANSLQEYLNKEEKFDIYGFLYGDQRLSSPSVISDMVSYFERHEEVSVTFSDLITQYPEFSETRYLHSEEVENVPFFMRAACAEHLSFAANEGSFHDAMNSLVSAGYPLYHIAEPLILEVK